MSRGNAVFYVWLICMVSGCLSLGFVAPSVVPDPVPGILTCALGGIAWATFTFMIAMGVDR